MGECGHLMGHLAVPNKDNVLTYLPIRCSSEPDHGPRDHAFIDPRSGMMVAHCFGTTVTVDERGCVVTP